MTYKIGVIEGDGVGPEVVGIGVQTLEAIAAQSDLDFEFVSAPVGGTCFLESGKVLPESSLEILKGCDAVLKGPMGRPDIEAGVVERDGILALRQIFEQYVNIRPVKLFKGLEAASPLKDRLLENGVDFVIIRENSEGLYARMGGMTATTATDINLFTQKGVSRILEFAFDVAKKRRGNLISVDKANVLSASLYWRRLFDAMAKEHPEIKCSSQLVDSFCILVLQDPSPSRWDESEREFCARRRFDVRAGSRQRARHRRTRHREPARHDFGDGDDAALRVWTRRFGAKSGKRRAKRARCGLSHQRHRGGREILHHRRNGRGGFGIFEVKSD